MKYSFSNAILENIERTYSYSYAKNAHNCDELPELYDPFDFFERLLKRNPFDAFMTLDGFAFKRTLNTITRYGIPYTKDQERRARTYYDVTQKMLKEKSDYVSFFVEDLKNTGIVVAKEPFVLTTQKTLDLLGMLNKLPVETKTDNILFDNKLDARIKETSEQYAALELCLSHKISCLIGGAGTGKSFVTAQLVDQLMLNGKSVSILAPTHKAREALQSKLKNGVVRTIHSFVHNPQECDVIVIDESGMLSTPLLHSLLLNYDNHQIIFVGDKNQLPPVDYGRPFERIQKRFKVAELKENHRSDARDIIALGREILGIPQNSNMQLNNITVVSDINEAFNQGAEVLLTYTNEDVKKTNSYQKIKNGSPSIYPEFSIGDKIIAKTNDRGRFFNGQLFTIIQYDLVKNDVTGQMVRIKNAKDMEYNFDLAYGLTIHKSQGSEWDTVAYKPSDLDTTNLAYVAVTRAKKKLIIVGDSLKDKYLSEKPWRQIDEINCI